MKHGYIKKHNKNNDSVKYVKNHIIFPKLNRVLKWLKQMCLYEPLLLLVPNSPICFKFIHCLLPLPTVSATAFVPGSSITGSETGTSLLPFITSPFAFSTQHH